jgi:poly-gamma-glutamate capsule biosynthesis protein CapA/YwtB (metallophosphatase superfamily)
MGDIMLGTENLLPPDGAKDFFRDVKPYLQGRDIVFGNLEGPLTDRGAPTKDTSTGRSFCFRTPPSYGEVLKDAGINIVSLANNHAMDYGPQGRAQTEEVLGALGILHTGAPGQITRMEVKGRPFAFIGLAPNNGCQNINDIDGAVALVKRAVADDPRTLVIVSMHGGAEGTARMRVPDGPETFLGENRGDLKRLSRAVIDAGAAMVIGHGPHVPRGAELYKGRLVAYSLGNFATASGINVKGATGLAPLLLAEIGPDGETVSYEFVSFRQQMNKGPRLDPADEAAETVRRLSEELSASASR